MPRLPQGLGFHKCWSHIKCGICVCESVSDLLGGIVFGPHLQQYQDVELTVTVWPHKIHISSVGIEIDVTVICEHFICVLHFPLQSYNFPSRFV